MTDKKITLIVNQKVNEVTGAQVEWPLVRYLREVLQLTSVRQGCDSEGTCGVCTIIINGKAKRSCMTRVSACDGARIETIEGLQVEAGQIPHPLLQTVIQDGIFQCGYCAPGALLSAKALLDENPNPSQKEIERVLSPVICRCAGLNRMDQSVQRAAAILRGEQPSTWTIEDTANEYLTLTRLTGILKYTDDLALPGMVYAQAVRARVPHARVKRIDTSKAEKMPGILKVLTSKDVPGVNIFGAISADQPIFCDENNNVRYVGDTLAVVVGETQEQAAAAAEAVAFDLEPLPVITNPRQALAPDAPILHERLRKDYPDKPNVLKLHQVRKGDPAAGFAEADIILECDYSTQRVEHAYMEVEASIAVPETDGSITIYCGSQGPKDDQHQIATALGVEQEKVRIAHMYMGGGFGGKEDIAGQIHVALAARAIGRPVKVRWSRAESLLVSYKRHPLEMHYKVGAKRDGTLVAAEISMYGDTGAYASAGEAVLFRTAAFACGPYVVPHVSVDSYAVHTNNPICGAFRGYGSPQVAFASELHMQKLAEALGMDPFEIRLKNALDLGSATITGDVMTKEVGVTIKACLMAVKEALQKTERPQLPPEEKLGIGIACAYKNVGLGSNIPDGAGARVILQRDGTFLVRHGGTDMGQGSNEVMTSIAARVLGVPVSKIQVHTGDTRYDPPGGMTTASRATFVSGNATLIASQKLREQLWQAISGEFSVKPEAIEIRDGIFVDTRSGKPLISLKDLAQGETVFEGSAHYDAPKTQPIPAHSESYPPTPAAPLHFAYDFGAQAALVAVNETSGAVRVLKMIAAHDVGKALLPRNVRGQIEGALIQGLGYALNEDFPAKDGIPQVTKFKDLGLARFRDIPQIEAIIVEDPHLLGPFGAKGMGELALAPTAPAIINAIHDAVGIWINDLPATKEKVKAALEKKHVF